MEFTVFVYGTLKKSFSNHHLLEGTEFLGPGKTLEKYSLYESGITYVFMGEPVSPFYGERYLIDSVIPKIIDKLEGHPS